MPLAPNLALLFRRDLSRLIHQIDTFPDDEMLWRQCPGIANSAGNLALHLEGNLREYVGRQIGALPYHRMRELEFSSKNLSRQQLSSRLAELKESIPSIVGALSSKQMESQYPEIVLEIPLSTQEFLVHLYGHLNWHLGQIDYLRRALSGNGALPRAGL